MTDFQLGQTVEWRHSAGQTWASSGTYLGLDRDWARVDTADGETLVRPHLLRSEGTYAAEDAALADLVERAKDYPIGDDDHARRSRENRFPWCDTCKRPSVANEFFGLMHSTADHPWGVPKHLDDSGHEVTHREWFTVPR